VAIKYRAIHEEVSWKKVGNHSSLTKAIDGEKGAKEVLRGNSTYVKKLWKERGKPVCIFVWSDDHSKGYAFRINPNNPKGEIQTVELPVFRLEEFEKAKGCTDTEIQEIFEHLSSSDKFIEQLYPDELSERTYPEGAANRVTVNSYERNPDARRKCIQYYGARCRVCEIDFESAYGEIGKGFIHIHHKIPISNIKDNYDIDPVNDLVPVCPNCHAMLHRTDPPQTIEQLRKIRLDNG
jgi:predicted HNH restriction endonuclease